MMRREIVGLRRSAAFLACFLGLAALTLVIGGCGGGNTLRGEMSIEGEVNQSHLPLARVVVKLEDISLADASSIEIATRTYTDVDTLPLDYELEWDERLNDRNDYSVGARVYDSEGALIYINDTVFTVEPGDSRMDFYVIEV